MHKSIIENINWWESKRPVYNLILITLICIILYLFREMAFSYGIFNVTVSSIALLILANIFYSLGWGIAILSNHYFSKYKVLIDTRWSQFIIGVLISVFLTIAVYKQELYYAFISNK